MQRLIGPFVDTASEEDHLTSSIVELKGSRIVFHHANIPNFMQHHRLRRQNSNKIENAIFSKVIVLFCRQLNRDEHFPGHRTSRAWIVQPAVDGCLHVRLVDTTERSFGGEFEIVSWSPVVSNESTERNHWRAWHRNDDDWQEARWEMDFVQLTNVQMREMENKARSYRMDMAVVDQFSLIAEMSQRIEDNDLKAPRSELIV